MSLRVRLQPHVGFVALALALAALVAVLSWPPVAQDPAYHAFADRRAWLGIPNFWNVASNLPFLLVGAAGLRFLAGPSAARLPATLMPVYIAFFLGAVFIGCGSMYYHWHPDNASLLWDRLPMTVAFMAFFCAVVSETASPAWGLRLFAPLLLVGALSVIYWARSEAAGHGDLRPYALIQFLPMLLSPLLLWLFPANAPGRGYWWAVLGVYAVAKLFELLDGWLYGALPGLGGHALKHVISAAGMYCFLLALRNRGEG